MFLVRRVDDPNLPYVEELRPIDEKICELLMQRDKMAGEHPGIPKWKQIEEWAERFEVEADMLHRIFSSMVHRNISREYVPPTNLRTVLPIIKSTEAHDCTFTITHMMQYENASVVFVDIVHRDSPHANVGHPQLILSVSPGDYQVRSKGGRGGGGEYHMEFVVTPALPDDLQNMKFELVKSGAPQHFRARAEIVLDQPVSFE